VEEVVVPRVAVVVVVPRRVVVARAKAMLVCGLRPLGILRVEEGATILLAVEASMVEASPPSYPL